MRAGGRLKGRKPASPAARHRQSATTTGTPATAAHRASMRAAISRLPPSSPSEPSRKFAALVAASSHSSATAAPTAPNATSPTPGRARGSGTCPAPTTAPAAANWATSRGRGADATDHPAARPAPGRRCRPAAPALRLAPDHRWQPAAPPAARAHSTPRPPAVGVGRRWALRASGASRIGRAISTRTTAADSSPSSGSADSSSITVRGAPVPGWRRRRPNWPRVADARSRPPSLPSRSALHGQTPGFRRGRR